MAKLPYISDDLLRKYVEQVVIKADSAEISAEAKLYSNVIDPFSAVFDASSHGITIDDWLVQEKSRQVQKTLQNAIGEFHQNILGSISGWENLGRGGSLDVRNEERKLVAEIKNKHNTLNSDNSEAVYEKLANELRYHHKGYTAYIVVVIPKTPVPSDKPWSPNHTTMTLRDDLRKIDGASFYDLATGHSGALKMLYEALPEVINDLKHIKASGFKRDKLFEDLFYRAYKK